MTASAKYAWLDKLLIRHSIRSISEGPKGGLDELHSDAKAAIIQYMEKVDKEINIGGQHYTNPTDLRREIEKHVRIAMQYSRENPQASDISMVADTMNDIMEAIQRYAP